MRRPRPNAIGIAAVLLPAALAQHEIVYAVAGGADRGPHGYLVLAVPILAAAAASLAIAALLMPALGLAGEDDRVHLRPLAIALALITLFAVQEGTEAFALGGGSAQLAAAFAAGWLLFPVSLALGTLGAAALEWLERAGLGLARLLSSRRPPIAHGRASGRGPRSFRTPRAPISPLAFGLARRPPPAAA